ncbi:hypothetical protein [Sorangium sp. So ce176]|uniref:hypothetical protein n=1 Tax=Sorangium sp. So ce176 TaxID=3133286 RepID=UPI003F61B872
MSSGCGHGSAAISASMSWAGEGSCPGRSSRIHDSPSERWSRSSSAPASTGFGRKSSHPASRLRSTSRPATPADEARMTVRSREGICRRRRVVS